MLFLQGEQSALKGLFDGPEDGVVFRKQFADNGIVIIPDSVKIRSRSLGIAVGLEDPFQVVCGFAHRRHDDEKWKFSVCLYDIRRVLYRGCILYGRPSEFEYLHTTENVRLARSMAEFYYNRIKDQPLTAIQQIWKNQE